MQSNFKPLLAGKVESAETLNYPVLASPKLDGIRSINTKGEMVSRSLKSIPNKYIQTLFADYAYDNLDGELIFGDPTAPDCYLKTNSAVMSHDGEPKVTFYVFDHIEFQDKSYVDRLDLIPKDLPNVVILPQHVINNADELLEFEASCLARGYEGVMVRDPKGKYKFGRSTTKEGTLLKLKRFEDAEAEIIGFDELMSNQNEATKDALGHTERSTNAEGMVPMNTLGALVCRTPEGIEFNVGTGFDAAQRQNIWDNRQEYLGKLCKYSHFAVGAKVKPRFPVFIGTRSVEDL